MQMVWFLPQYKTQQIGLLLIGSAFQTQDTLAIVGLECVEDHCAGRTDLMRSDLSSATKTVLLVHINQ